MAVLKKIKFGELSHNIQFTEVKPASGGVITATPTHTGEDDGNNPEYAVDLTIVDDGTLVKDNGALKVGTVPAAQVSVAAGGHDSESEPADDKTFEGENVEAVLLELNEKIEQTGNVARTYTLVDDTENVQDLPTTVLKRYRLQETIGTQSPTLVGANIDIPKDSSLKEVYLGASTDTINTETGVITKNTVTDPQSMNFAYQLADGTYSLVKIDVSKFLTESEFGDGLEVSNAGVVSVNAGNGLGFDSSDPKKVQVVVDSTSEAFLTVSAGGVKLAGVQDAIDAAVEALDVTDTAVAGQYVSAVNEADGKVSMARANVSDAVLTGYAKGTKPASTAIDATDDVKGAIAKLEHQIDDAKAAATTKVAKDAAASHLTLTNSTAADGSVTYTIGESDIASKTDLDAEIAARKAVDGQSGQTYATNTSANYISGATSLNDADVKLDAAIKTEETRAQNAETAIDGAVGLTKAASGEGRTYSNTGEYIGKQATNTVTSDIKALDTQLQTVSTNLANIKYNVDGTTLILSGIAKDTSLTA